MTLRDHSGEVVCVGRQSPTVYGYHICIRRHASTCRHGLEEESSFLTSSGEMAGAALDLVLFYILGRVVGDPGRHLWVKFPQRSEHLAGRLHVAAARVA